MAIRDTGYTSYNGDLSAGTPSAWVIATNDLRLYWSYKRTKLLFIAMMFLMVPFVLAALAERPAMNLFKVDPDQAAGVMSNALGYTQIWMLVIFFAGVCGGVIADDVRYRTIQLYFSKPIQPMDYILGKFTSLMLIGTLVTVVPTLLVGGIRLAIASAQSNVKDAPLEFVGLLGFVLILLCLFSLIIMALSALTERTGYVVLAWMGVILVPSMISTTTGLVLSDQPWPELISVVGSLSLALKALIGYTDPAAALNPNAAVETATYMKWAFWPVLIVIASACGGIIHWRISKIEGIA